MKWTVLADNRTGNDLQEISERQRQCRSCSFPDDSLQTEHGLSILLETGNHRLLLDTGASDVFIHNAQLMNIDLSTVDAVFISHGHSDHAGGLRHFFNINDRAKVIVSPHAVSGKFYSKRKILHSITTSWPENIQERCLMVDSSCEIADGLHVIAHIPHHHPVPQGNSHLLVQDTSGNYVPDDFQHELALYTNGLLFTGCAHSGLENILDACPWPVEMVVGGFHLLDGHEAEEDLVALGHRLPRAYPQTHFYTSHCTGDTAFTALKQAMGHHLHSFRCGTICES